MRANGQTTVIAVLLAAAAALSGACYWHEASDDAYITLRYGGNIARGAGWVYNDGERVPGSTSPLWTLVCAGCSLTGLDPAASATFLGIVCVFLSALLVYLLLRAEIGELPAATAALLCELTILNAYASGLEFALLILLGLAAVALYVRGRAMAAAVALALMILTRADGVLLAAVLLADFCLRRRRVPWREALVCAALLAPWFIFSGWYFGSFLPHTLEAKSAQLESGFWFWSYSHNAGRMLLRTVSADPLHLLALPLAVSGLLARGAALRVILCWCGLYFAAYSALGVPGYAWYYVIPAYGLGILSAAGVSVARARGWGGRIAGGVLAAIFCASLVAYPMGSVLKAAGRAYIDRKLRAAPQNHPAGYYYKKADEMIAAMRTTVGVENPPVGLAAAAILFGVLLCCGKAGRGPAVWEAVFCALLLLPRLGDFETLAREIPSARAIVYTRIAEWMRANLPPRSVVAMEEIGIVGYHSKLPVVDLGGIVTPSIARDLAAGDRAAWLYRFQPDYILLQDLWIFEEPVRERAYFHDGYEEVRSWPRDSGLVARLYRRTKRWEGQAPRPGSGTAIMKWDFRNAADAGRWSPVNPRETAPEGRSPDGFPRYAVSGDDSSLAIGGLEIDPARIAGATVRVKITPRLLRRKAGIAYLEWGEKGSDGYSPERKASFSTKANGRFMTYSIDLSDNDAWRRARTVTSLKINPTDIASTVEWADVELRGHSW